jgi:hypothetical protein
VLPAVFPVEGRVALKRVSIREKRGLTYKKMVLMLGNPGLMFMALMSDLRGAVSSLPVLELMTVGVGIDNIICCDQSHRLMRQSQYVLGLITLACASITGYVVIDRIGYCVDHMMLCDRSHRALGRSQWALGLITASAALRGAANVTVSLLIENQIVKQL